MILSDRKIRNLSPKAGDPDDAALVLERVFDAPPAAVFSLWSDPAHVREWWHPAGYTTPVFEMDFRVGGGLSILHSQGRAGRLGPRRLQGNRCAAAAGLQLPMAERQPRS
jgi:hypothetical protein